MPLPKTAPFPLFLESASEDERFMLEALKEAWKAFQLDEVPVGAVLVYAGQIIARGHNQVEMLCDATAHAEMICLTAGATARDNWRLEATTMYCTLEPCSMCAGAMLLSRLPRLVWGAADMRHGANGSWTNLFALPHPTHTIAITSHVLADYAAALLRCFFQQKRKTIEGVP